MLDVDLLILCLTAGQWQSQQKVEAISNPVALKIVSSQIQHLASCVLLTTTARKIPTML